ncbi:hypothetical protein AKJ09_09074 [Labilithrix luteola]|uniref:Uncharacterized protein n=1 Tax=Labilithrix luteola TaxID=1391654 RepID=A0A0K1Q9E0_9BACT|nr:hypothetical protein [Labilithrix luteola]AKV02411.1 hypothetical protein AKJ09_09074 [Labilithrix luteola]
MSTSSSRMPVRAESLPSPPTAFRLVGPAAKNVRDRVAPFRRTFRDDGDAYAVALGTDDALDLTTVARALPDVTSVESGALVVLLPQIVPPPSLAVRVLVALGRGRTVSRALRCSALLAKGYTRIGAGIDPDTRADLVWGYAPTRS